MQELMDSLEEVKRTKAELDKANDAMRQASAAHQNAVNKAAELHQKFNAEVAQLIPTTKLARAS